MKNLVYFITIVLISTSGFAATGRGMVAQSNGSPRAAAAKNQIMPGTALTAKKSSIKAETPSAAIPIDKRDKEKKACMNNNIGTGNTFVWASKYSNTNNYASMIEDTENPENNVCFVRVELKSADSKINVSDVPAVYYEMGREITCGSWADEAKLKQRILDSKKSARTWGTVAGAVGGAGVGVGAMELFGNKLIGGSVQGQKGMNENEQLRSQIAVLKKESPVEHSKLIADVQILKKECDNWNSLAIDAPSKPDGCTLIDYNLILGL